MAWIEVLQSVQSAPAIGHLWSSALDIFTAREKKTVMRTDVNIPSTNSTKSIFWVGQGTRRHLVPRMRVSICQPGSMTVHIPSQALIIKNQDNRYAGKGVIAIFKNTQSAEASSQLL